MFEENMLSAVTRLRGIDKIPNLNACFPGEELDNGDIVYKCESDNKTNDGKTYRISFDVVIKRSDFDKTTQQVDIDAKIERLPLDEPDPSKSRITLRFAYRIWTSYEKVITAIHKYAEDKLGL